MKRNDYQKPTMKVVQLKHRTQMLQSSPYTMSAKGRREQLEDDTQNLGW